jgi:hypothetical protein
MSIHVGLKTENSIPGGPSTDAAIGNGSSLSVTIELNGM